MTDPLYRILIVDSHTIVRQALRVLLARCNGFSVVGDCDGNTAVARALELRPHVVLMDLRVPEIADGLRLIGQLHENLRETRIIALTVQEDEEDLVYCAVRAGAVACVLKGTSDIDEVELAIRQVSQGRVFLSTSALASLVASISRGPIPQLESPPDSIESLSPREYDVLDLVAQGLTNRQIADQLVISESTVRSHLHNILDKLQVANRVQAAAYALRTRPSKSGKTTTHEDPVAVW